LPAIKTEMANASGYLLLAEAAWAEKLRAELGKTRADVMRALEKVWEGRH
jgi:hypothetical protein